MDNIYIRQEKETSHMAFSPDEASVLRQIARLLVRERFMTREEQIRFLAFLKEGD